VSADRLTIIKKFDTFELAELNVRL
jgi:hypothetical protein